MKKFFAFLISASVLASPLAAQAQDWHKVPDRHRAAVLQKKVVISKTRWVKGHRISAAERRHMAEVRDYRRYRLSAPPRGYHWVKVDKTFLLVGLTTGFISSVVVAR
jgi:Ni/Co efflux regulator RcnB